MKTNIKVLWILITVSLFTGTLYGQCPPEEGEGEITTLDGQTAIDSFAQNYTDNTVWSLRIEGPITDLSPLSFITTIEDDLRIETGYNDITTLAGLENLTSIGGRLTIVDNSLTNLIGLEGLTSIGGSLMFQETEELSNFEGLNNLVTIGGSITFTGDTFDDGLSFEGLDNLVEVGGNISLGYDLECEDYMGLESLQTIGGNLVNENLVSLEGLDNLQTIGGRVEFEGSGMVNFQGLNSLESIGTSLYLDYIQGLNFTTAFANLEAIGGSFQVHNSDDLISFNGLEALDSIGSNLSIKGNDDLESIDALQNLEYIGRDVTIESNPLLTACCVCWVDKAEGFVSIENNDTGCNGVGEIYEDCTMSCNTVIQTACYTNVSLNTQADVDAFGQNNTCDIIYGNITLPYTNTVTDLSPLLSIKEIHGNLEIDANSLTNFSGLDSLRYIKGNLTVESSYWDEDLTSFTGIEHLEEIGGDLYMEDFGENLTSLTDFSGLHTVGGDFTLERFKNLSDGIDGFQNLTSIGGDVYFGLSLGEGYSGLDNLLTIDGDMYFYGSAIGDFNEFPNLESIGGKLTFEDNDELESIGGFNSLTTLGSIYIFNGTWFMNGSFVLPALESVGSVKLDDGFSLVYFPNVVTMGFLSAYYGNDGESHTNFNLPNLETLGGIGITATVDFTDFDNVTTIIGSCSFTSLNLLNTDGFENLECIGGNFSLEAENVTDCCNILCIAEKVSGNVDLEDSADGCNSLEVIAANCPNSPCLPEDAPAMLQAKVILQGAFNGTDMNTSLTEVLPLNQPYTIAPYNYNGTETLSNIPNDMVDWILVEMRDGTPNISGSAGTQVVETQAAILLADGNIVNTAGDPLTFNNLNTGEAYHLCIRHRNHLDILSSQTINASANMNYDFTTSQDQAFGTSQQISLSNGTFGMYTGDYNQDGIIQLTDYDLWIFSPAQNNVYDVTDGTLDAVIQVTDLDAWLPNKAKIGNIEIQY